MEFFDRDREYTVRWGTLPHWEQEGVVAFVTFRLADSLPQPVLRRWKADYHGWLQLHPEPWDESTELEYERLFSNRLHRYLDAGYGSCVLLLDDVREIVSGAVRFFDRQRYELDQWCIAANHVHVLVTPAKGHDLAEITHTWKSYTSHEIGKIAEARERLGGPTVWQAESFDHLVRSGESLERIRGYIRKHDR